MDEVVSNRQTQTVLVGNDHCDYASVRSSVPQGTCFYPVLFSLYINDIVNVVENSEIFLFADDCKLFYVHGRNDNLRMLQNDLDRVTKRILHK